MTVWIHQALMGYFKGFPCGIFNLKGQKWVLRMALSKSKAKKAAKDAAAEKERKCLASEAAGEGEN